VRTGGAAHEPVVQKLVFLVDANPTLRAELDDALSDQPPSSYWYNKDLEDMYDFFDKWVVFLPTIDNARLHMDAFYEFAGSGKGREAVAKEPFRSWLYEFMMAVGEFMDSSQSAAAIPWWTSDPRINMEDYIIPPGGYQSFNEFFTRSTKPGSRPIDSPDDASVLISPADCAILKLADTLTSDTKLEIKGESLNIRELLGNDRRADDFINGKAILFMLNTTNYHRYHSPVQGRIVSQHQLAGLYYGMDGGWVEYFFQHRRGYLIFDTQKFGHVAMVCVGMFTISSVSFVTSEGDFVKKGQELGNFAYGGSAIILLFEPDAVTFSIPLDRGPVYVNMGQKIGSLEEINTYAPPPAPRPSSPSPTFPRLATQYLSVNPPRAYAGQPVTISTNVVNTGGDTGNYNVVLRINGQVGQQRMVSVGPGASYPVKFIITKSQPGTYSVNIDSQQSSFTILSAGHTTGKHMNGGFIAFIILATLILATAVTLILTYRRPI
jgi:phosphatidylserine decarboxylase